MTGVVGEVALPMAVATGFFLLKLFNIACLSRALSAKYQLSSISSWVAAWTLILAFQTAAIIVLSIVSRLERLPFVLLWLAFSLALYVFCRRCPERTIAWRTLRDSMLPMLVAALVLIVLWLRAAFLFDATWDAQTYGLPRLILWLQAKSVLIHMDTPQINLFTNEWIAELNMLAYALVSGDYLGLNFGNLECLLVLGLALIWTARQLGVPPPVAAIIAAALMSTPAIVGLATVMKGDLLACVAIVVAFGWLLQVRTRSQPVVALCFLLISVPLAVGAKISTAFVGVALAILALVDFGSSIGLFKQRRWWPVSAVVVMACLAFLSRYALNFAVYRNPFRRAENERATFDVANLAENLKIARRHLVPFSPTTDLDTWALSASLGLSVWLILILIVIAVATAPPQRGVKPSLDARAGTGSGSSKWLLFVAGAIAVAILMSMTLGQAYPWTFRYFLPGILVLVLIACSSLKSLLLGRWLIFAFCIVVAVQIFAWALPGEIVHLPTGGGRLAIGSPITRVTSKFADGYNIAALKALRIEDKIGHTILVFQSVDSPLLPLLGISAPNRITLMPSVDRLLDQAARGGWDAVVVSLPARVRDPDIRKRLNSLGYRVLLDNVFFMLALPARRLEIAPVIDLGNTIWNGYGGGAGIRLTTENGGPEVQSESAVDAGLLTQPVTACGDALVEARVSGTVAAGGDHAAHLSIYGVAPLLLFPSGEYGSTETFQGYAQMPCQPVRLAFGLGGWGVGEGRIRLVNFAIYHLKIKESSPDRDLPLFDARQR
jgi:hypothetical protein